LIRIANQDGALNPTPHSLTPDFCYILGGPSLVQDIPGATRIYGDDRYATNQALCDVLPFASDHIFIADGGTLVDALTGSALAAKTQSPIVLTHPGQVKASLDTSIKWRVLGGGSE
jgi:putative cell wall-binding protein